MTFTRSTVSNSSSGPGLPSFCRTRTVPPRPAQCTTARSGSAPGRDLHGCGHVVGVGHVRRGEGRGAAELGGPLRARGRGQVDDHHLAAALGQPLGGGPAEAGRTPGHHHGGSAQVHQEVPFRRRGSAEALEDQRVRHAPGLAHGLQTVPAAGRLQLVEQRGEQPHSRGPERVAEGNGAAAGVDQGRVHVELGEPGQRDRRERLVDLHRVELAERKPAALEYLAGRRDRPGEHQRRIIAAHRRGDDAGARAQAECGCPLLAHHQDGPRPVGDLRGVARGDLPFHVGEARGVLRGGEGGREPGEPLRGGPGPDRLVLGDLRAVRRA